MVGFRQAGNRALPVIKCGVFAEIHINLSLFRADVDFSQWSLSIEGMPMEPEGRQNRHAEDVRGAFARANATSSAGTEMRKNIGVPLRGKIGLSEKNDRFIC